MVFFQSTALWWRELRIYPWETRFLFNLTHRVIEKDDDEREADIEIEQVVMIIVISVQYT